MTEQLTVNGRLEVQVTPTVPAPTGTRQHRGAGIAAGCLFIVGTAAGILSKVFLASVSDATDPVASASTNETAVIIGAMLILTMGLALALIPVVLMPVLRPVSDVLAYGYLVIRGAVETACYVVVAAATLSLVALARLDSPDESLRGIGRVLIESEAMAVLAPLVFCLGAALFYLALFRSGIAPRWLSGWGLIGIPLYVAAALLAAFGVVELDSTAQTLLFMPLAVQEMALAVWMIARGFRPARPR